MNLTPHDLADRVPDGDRGPSPRSGSGLALATLLYGLLLAAFWWAARHFSVTQRFSGHLPSAFLSFALLLAPYWFFGFGAASMLKRKLASRIVRVLLPGSLVVPYLVFAIPQGQFQPVYAAAFFLLPVILAALFEFLPPATQKLSWQDVLALVVIGIPVEFRVFASPFPGLSALPKFLLMDAALYAFFVVRGIDGVGYDFRARLRDLLIGLREWAFFAPVAIGLGLAIGFIRFHRQMPGVPEVTGALLVTFFFVALPEVFFFLGLLKNLLEGRLGKLRGLFVASAVFGLSHFNKPGPFNLRYVLLATIAGLFYGRAWSDRRRLVSSATTHTLVDVVWSLWFKL